MFGLMDAIASFEPGRGVPFEAFASGRIRGAMLDELRYLDWVPRAVHRKENDLERARKDLRSDLKREPSDEELRRALGLSPDQFRQMLHEIRRCP